MVGSSSHSNAMQSTDSISKFVEHSEQYRETDKNIENSKKPIGDGKRWSSKNYLID